MRILFIGLVLCIVIGCKKAKTDASVPNCITEKINAILKKQKGSGPGFVNEYIYENKRVFHFAPYCCDAYGEVVDENCNFICAPDGGITGKGDGRCVYFFQTATFVKEVWKDTR